jgi:hypothetical protein
MCKYTYFLFLILQGAVMDPFEHDPEKEWHYAEALSVDIDIIMRLLAKNGPSGLVK